MEDIGYPILQSMQRIYPPRSPSILRRIYTAVHVRVCKTRFQLRIIIQHVTCDYYSYKICCKKFYVYIDRERDSYAITYIHVHVYEGIQADRSV